MEELKQVIQEVEDYKIKKAELERKIDVINGLKANQRGPVQIMDQVSRALPELLWLNNLDVTPTTIDLRGSAFNMSAVANFIDNLDKVDEFAEPILNDATQKAARGARSEIYDFKVNLGYSFKKAQAPTLTTDIERRGRRRAWRRPSRPRRRLPTPRRHNRRGRSKRRWRSRPVSKASPGISVQLRAPWSRRRSSRASGTSW